MTRWLALFVSLLLLPLSATAADRWYEIEVIVFAQINGDWNIEHWPDNEAVTLSIDDAVPAPNTITTPMAMSASIANAQELLRMAAVPPAQYKLLDVYRSLTRSKNYRPLLHTAWRQPIGASKDNVKIRIAGGKDFASRYGLNGRLLSNGAEPASAGLWEVDGQLRLTASKFLHAETELVFRRPVVATAGAVIGTTTGTAPTPTSATAPATGASGQIATGTTGINDEPVLIDEDRLQFFKLSQNRRLKSNELQYFDHPMFGLLIVLRPLEPEMGRSTSGD